MNTELDLNPQPSGIPVKDIKILWGHSAGKCAICRKKLTQDTSINVETTGHMCHIVGEKNNEKSPRGHSNLTKAERNSYSNLILLCRNHHAEIDNDEIKYSIEKLHDIKSKHEIWINETLGPEPRKPSEKVYYHLIDYLEYNLKLSEWWWFSENAVRQLLHRDFIDSAENISAKKLSIIWPKDNLELENSISNLIDSFLAYIEQFLIFAEPRTETSDIFAPPKHYRNIQDVERRFYEADKENLWARENFLLLCQYTLCLNDFSNRVRQYINPYFYLTNGKFILRDTLGTHHGGQPTFIDPSESVIKEITESVKLDIEKLKENKHFL